MKAMKGTYEDKVRYLQNSTRWKNEYISPIVVNRPCHGLNGVTLLRTSTVHLRQGIIN